MSFAWFAILLWMASFRSFYGLCLGLRVALYVFLNCFCFLGNEWIDVVLFQTGVFVFRLGTSRMAHLKNLRSFRTDDNAQICYTVLGEGPIHILFIMGMGSTIESWSKQTEYFGEQHGNQFSCLFFDNRGSGRSSSPRGIYTIAQLASDVKQTLNYLNWTRFHVMGMSMGSMIALELCASLPSDWVQSLTLLSAQAGLLYRSLCSWFQKYLLPFWRRCVAVIWKPFEYDEVSVDGWSFPHWHFCLELCALDHLKSC